MMHTPRSLVCKLQYTFIASPCVIWSSLSIKLVLYTLASLPRAVLFSLSMLSIQILAVRGIVSHQAMDALQIHILASRGIVSHQAHAFAH